jgi:hypothetical protein
VNSTRTSDNNITAVSVMLVNAQLLRQLAGDVS